MAPQRTPINQQQRQGAATSTSTGPAASTPAAQQQQQQQQQHQYAFGMVLPLLLQHDSVRTRLRLVCSLLCCSKAVAAAVAEHCAGQLALPRLTEAWMADGPEQVDRAKQIAPWLRKHAQLVRSLDLQISSEAAEHVVSALVAAGPQSLQLQSLKADSIAAALPLLEQLPARFLTQLDFRTQEGSVQPQDLAAVVARTSAALGRLTALRTLELHRRSQTMGRVPVPALPGLAALTQLTFLKFSGPTADLQHVSPQLLELELQHPQPQPLELSHLTALTALTCEDVAEGDVLPANLLTLSVGSCRSVGPLLPLQQLRQLDVTFDPGADITADQLRQFSRLITSLSLAYSTASIEPASAAAWPLLPLQRLKLCRVSLSAAECQSLAQLSGLTSLQLAWYTLPQAASAQQLAAALRQLSGLQQLQLQLHPDRRSGPATTEQQVSEGAQKLVQAVGSLQQLQGLDIFYSSELAAVAAATGTSLAALTGLTSLTSLSVARCDLSNAAMAAVVSQLPRLQRLDCGGNSQLTDAGLFAIARLQQLTELVLSSTRVADAGMTHLTGLVRLRKLNLGGTNVTDAGMRHLCGMTQLQELSVPGCVSVEQRRWLQQRLPELNL